jgi:asparagine synthase (glutamine-hydrolysing)
MASGIETRFPYLNANLQKFSLSLPDTFKLSLGFTKYILRKAFVNELPNKLLFRKDKEGFDTGKEFFLKKNQIFLQKNILNEDSLIFKEKIVSIKFLKYFNDYLNSFFFKRNYDLNFLFRVISFEIWLHVFKKYLNFNNR